MFGAGTSVGRAIGRAARVTVCTLAVAIGLAVVVTTSHAPKAVASRPNDDDGQAKAAKAAPGDNHIVQLDPDSQEKGGIATSLPQPTAFRSQERVYGTVLALDRLTTLYNASLTAATQLKAAEAKATASRVANERAQNLLKVFPTAKAQAETASAGLELDQIGVDTARTQIETIRNSAIQDWGPALGAAIADRAPLARDLVLRKLCLVQITLAANEAASPPPRLTLQVAAGSIEGRFIAAAPQVDARVQGAGFLYVAPVIAGLAPGASLVALVPRGGSGPGLDIPASAVVWQDGKPWMYLRTAPNRFERRPLDEAAEPTSDGGYIVPARSLPSHNELVVAGAQVLLSQESRAQIPSDEDDN